MLEYVPFLIVILLVLIWLRINDLVKEVAMNGHVIRKLLDPISQKAARANREYEERFDE